MAYHKKTIFNRLSMPLQVTSVVAAGALGFAAGDAMYGQVDVSTSDISEKARFAAERDFQQITDLNDEIQAASYAAEVEYTNNGHTADYRQALRAINDKAEDLEDAKERFIYRAYTNAYFSEHDFLEMANKAEDAGFDMPVDMSGYNAQHLEACRVKVADSPTPLAPTRFDARRVESCASNKAFDGFVLSILSGFSLALIMGVGLADGRGKRIFETAPNNVYRRVTKPKPTSKN